MGLDISAYSKVKFDLPYDEENDYYHRLENHPDFAAQLGDLKGKVFLVEKHRPKKTDEKNYEEHIGFRAGSYGGYGQFRRTICKIVNDCEIEHLWAELEKEDAYYGDFTMSYLLNFSDCEGYICAEISDILFTEFVINRAKVLAAVEKNPSGFSPWFMETYDNWTRAFGLAKDNGLVTFH